MTRVTLLTDFGGDDGYVAAMKGVIAATQPNALIEDAAHDVPPGDIAAAAWALRRYWRLYPEGSVHVVVVDPGVGSERRALAVQADGRFLVGPDNGVLSHVLREAEAIVVVALENAALFRPRRSHTFHGRDVFAPVAAHLAGGGAIEELGPRVDNPVQLVWPEPAKTAAGAGGQVVHVDHFGNLVTNVPRDWLSGRELVWVEDRMIGPLRHSYSEVEPGDLLALIGSEDLLEVSVRDGSAAAVLEVGRGAAVWARQGGE